VIVSVGGTNIYGHSDPEALFLYRNAAAYRDSQGTIVVSQTGQTLHHHIERG
jgi:hypothetical protein